MINVSLYMTQLLTPSPMTCLEVTMLSLLGAAHDGTAGTFTLSKRIAKRECLQFMCTCNTKSIWTMEGGTRARGLDRASSSFTLRVMVFRKCSRASWRTDGSFPWTWTRTRIHTPMLRLMSDKLFRSMTGPYLDGVEDGLKHIENIAKEKVPCLSQRVQ